jgi:hypothetical protein
MKMRLVALVVLAISFALPAFSQQKDAQEKTQTAQQHADRADNQRSALEAELKNAQEEKAKDAQDAALVAKICILLRQSRSALETELKKAQDEEAELAQQNANLASQNSALETQEL